MKPPIFLRKNWSEKLGQLTKQFDYCSILTGIQRSLLYCTRCPKCRMKVCCTDLNRTWNSAFEIVAYYLGSRNNYCVVKNYITISLILTLRSFRTCRSHKKAYLRYGFSNEYMHHKHIWHNVKYLRAQRNINVKKASRLPIR